MELKQIVKNVVPDDVIIAVKRLVEGRNNKRMLNKKATVAPYMPQRYPMGINLIGDIRAETGLGQSMRILAGILEEGGIPFVIKQVDSPGGLQHDNDDWESRICEECKYAVNLIHINPGIWAENYNRFPKEMLDYRYNVAYWLWELEEFPKRWTDCIETVDEIWTPSEFISKSIRKRTKKKVTTVPYNIKLDNGDAYGRDYFHLPEDKYLFLVMYDFKSISERKNPQAVIEAYKQAFSDTDSGVGLVIKINHLKQSKELEQLKQQLEGYSNIYYITDNLSRKEVESLIAVSDVLVSLHRSEGFGLPLAEAMYLGTSVIATNWSANTEFMDKESACLVDYTLIEIKKNIGPYEKGNYWAEADVKQAADYMKKLYHEKDYHERMCQKGKAYIREVLNVDRPLKVISKKLGSI